jgi:16S rRNA (guanine527-N7)-methyltransferase
MTVKEREELERAWETPLRRYAEILSRSEIRLTGTRDAEEIYSLHIRDSLYAVPLLPEAGRVVDVGSGGGLPGMVWAICRPDLSVTLLDSAGKKCRASEAAAGELGLGNVTVVWGRCEDCARDARETFIFAAARALAHAGVLAEYLSPLVAPGGRLLAFKGPKGAAELREVGDRWNALGLGPPRSVPYGPEDRNGVFVLWDKTAPCPRAYPRKAGTAGARNWWK